jgi:membrane-associated phospholipid phosphatase
LLGGTRREGRAFTRLLAAAIILLTGSAVAEPSHWYQGAAGRRRVTHLVVFAVSGGLYVSSETFLKDDLAPTTCRRCAPLGFDRSVRNSVVWNDTALAGTLGDLEAFVLAPVVGLGLTALAWSGTNGDRVGRWIDDAAPILQSAVFSGLVNQVVKFAVGRRRPFVQFGDPTRPPDLDDNTSFYSGHTTLAFAIATSAGTVAHRRGYRLEPLIWAAGYTLATTTGYLRIAADRHYFTDVATGAVVGTAIGLAVPLLLHRHIGGQIDLVPTGRGIALVGGF